MARAVPVLGVRRAGPQAADLGSGPWLRPSTVDPRHRRGPAPLGHRPVPDRPQPHRRRRARDARLPGRPPARADRARGPVGHPCLRLDRARRVERPRPPTSPMPTARGSSTHATCNLHLVGYSEPVDVVVTREELDAHLHSLPELPDAIPYVTSYYRRTWGFCVDAAAARRTGPRTRSTSSSTATSGPGTSRTASSCCPARPTDEVLLSTYVCHPSMANNELSGPVVATALARWIAGTAAAPVHLPDPLPAGDDRLAHLPQPTPGAPPAARPGRLGHHVHRRRGRLLLRAVPLRHDPRRPRLGPGDHRTGPGLPALHLPRPRQRRAAVLLPRSRPARGLPHALEVRPVRRVPHVAGRPVASSRRPGCRAGST